MTKLRLSRRRRIKRILFKEGHRCHYCNMALTFASATIDHIIPLAKGGSNAIANCIISCYFCNQIKGDIDYFSFLKNKENIINNKSYYMMRSLFKKYNYEYFAF